VTCESLESRIALYASGDLEAAEATPVEAHLAVCEACRALAAELAANQDALASLADEDVDAAARVVRGRVRAALDGAPRRSPWAHAPWAALAASILIAAAVLLPREPPARMVEATRATATPEARSAKEVIAVTPSQPTPLATESRGRANTPLHRRRVVVAGNPETPVAPRKEALPDAPERPLVVKLVTSDPNVVIYWVLDQNGGPS